MAKITITNQSGPVAVVDIEGIIGVPEPWQFDEPGQRVATYETFRRTVESLSEVRSPEVVVNIRSTGGNVNDALLIYDALTGLQGRITTRCFGYVASAATIIAQAASPGCREISSNSLYLVHKSVTAAEGNTEQMHSTLGMLEQTDARIAAVYAARSGKPVENFEALMRENSGNGRWLSPDEVLAAGLADRVIASGTLADAAQVAALGLPPVPRAASSAPSSDNRWNAILDALGLRRRAQAAALVVEPEAPSLADQTIDSMARAQNEMSDAHRRQVAELRSRIDRLEAQNARLSVGPTTTRPKEDPSPQEVRRTPNEDAYLADAKGFK
jgi:ATP-dependent protease ClpP protease subunit